MAPLTVNTYNVTVTDINNCQSFASVTLGQILGCPPSGVISQGKLNNFKVYPNPVTDMLTMAGSDLDNGTYTYELKNLMGQLVFADKFTINNNSIQKSLSLSDLPNGIYSLMVETGNSKMVYKIYKTN